MKQSSYTNLSPEEFKQKATEANTIILDVRTAAECAAGIIEGAVTELDMYNGEFEEKFKSSKITKLIQGDSLVFCNFYKWNFIAINLDSTNIQSQICQ